MKALLILAIACLGASSARALDYSQESSLTAAVPRSANRPSRADFRVTPVAGLSLMSLKNDNGDDAASTDSGLAVGALVDVGRGMATFQTGLIYNQFGGRTSTSAGDEVVSLDYLSIPIVGKLNVLRNVDRTFYLKGGLMPSLLLDRRVKVSSDESRDFSARPADLAAVGGIGAALPISPGNSLILDAQYIRGLLSVSEGTQVLHSEGFSIMAGLSIALD